MAKGTQLVEFVGLPSPYAHPDIQKALGAPLRSLQERRERRSMRRELLRQEQHRQMQGFARVTGRTRLTLGPQHGLTGTYVWGPDRYEVEMPADDIERLMRMHPAHALAFHVRQHVIVVHR